MKVLLRGLRLSGRRFRPWRSASGGEGDLEPDSQVNASSTQERRSPTTVGANGTSLGAARRPPAGTMAGPLSSLKEGRPILRSTNAGKRWTSASADRRRSVEDQTRSFSARRPTKSTAENSGFRKKITRFEDPR